MPAYNISAEPRPKLCKLCNRQEDRDKFWTLVRNFVINKFKKIPIILPQGFTNLKTLFSHVLMTKVCRGRDSKTQTSACKVNALTDCIIAAAAPLNMYRKNKICWSCVFLSNNSVYLHGACRVHSELWVK